MPRALPILILSASPVRLSELCGGDRAFGRRCVVRRWQDLESAGPLPRLALAVVLSQNGGGGARRDLRRLRRRIPGVPILAAGSPRAPHAPWADAALRLPLRAGELEALASRLRGERKLEGERRRLRERLRQAEATLAALGAIARTANAILEPRRVTEIVAEGLRALMRAEVAVVYRLGEDGRTLTPSPAYARGRSRECGFTLRTGEGVAGAVAQRRRVARLGERDMARVKNDPFDARMGLRTRHCLAAPLVSRGRVLGVIELRNRSGRKPFERADQRALEELSEAAAIAIDNALLFQRSQELSVTDDLTKLYNSRYLNDTLAREVKRARRYEAHVSLIFLDLDGFKKVNDQHGHLVGSRTLIEVGQVLREAVREIDVVARYGGDEFTVVLPQTDPAGAQVIAERIRQAIAEQVFMGKEGLDVRLTASLGVATFPKPCGSPEELIRAADQAMYGVKARGRDGVAMAE